MKLLWASVLLPYVVCAAATEPKVDSGLEGNLDLLFAIIEREEKQGDAHWKRIADFIEDVEKKSKGDKSDGQDIVNINYRSPRFLHHHHKGHHKRVNQEEDFSQFYNRDSHRHGGNYHGGHHHHHRRSAGGGESPNAFDTIAHVIAIENEVERRSFGEDELSPWQAAIHAALYESNKMESTSSESEGSWDSHIMLEDPQDAEVGEETEANHFGLDTILHIAVKEDEVDRASGGTEQLSGWQAAIHAAIFESDKREAKNWATIGDFVDLVMDIAGDVSDDNFWSGLMQENAEEEMEPDQYFTVRPEELKYPLTAVE
jgi:hypothetical protein